MNNLGFNRCCWKVLKKYDIVLINCIIFLKILIFLNWRSKILVCWNRKRKLEVECFIRNKNEVVKK